MVCQSLEITPNDTELWYNRGMASAYTSRFGRSLRDYERATELHSITALTGELEKTLKVARKLVKESLKMRGPHFTLDQLIEQEDLFHRGLELMQAGKWAEAGQAFQAAIAMGDCLPQPWGNLGISLMMQERYDEAEAAFRRALVIDPKYTLAKQNLAMLPETRRLGPPKMKDPLLFSHLPHLRVAKHHLGRTIHICRKNANLTLAVAAIAHAIDFLLIHIQIDATAVGYNCHQVGLIQTSVDGTTTPAA